MLPAKSTSVAIRIESRILFLREQKIMIDADLAELYRVSTGALVQAVKRNLDRIPTDFMFQTDTAERDSLRSQTVISNGGRGGRRYPPYAFTEQGVAMHNTLAGPVPEARPRVRQYAMSALRQQLQFYSAQRAAFFVPPPNRIMHKPHTARRPADCPNKSICRTQY